MMKVLRVLMWFAYPVVLIMLFASLLTSHPYMRLSEGMYESHEAISYDHGYVAGELIDYLNYRHDDLTFGAFEGDDTVLMRAIEIRHMEDVKDVYTNLRILAGISLIVLIGAGVYLYKRDVRFFYETVKNSFWLPLAIIAFVGTWVLIDFGRLFTWFHLLFFDNDDWILRSDDALIQLLPQNFWMVSGIIILVGTASLMGITLMLNRKFIRPKIL